MKVTSLLAVFAALLCATGVTQAAHLSDLEAAVLNFALNLEYLEANFYWCVAYGKPIGADYPDLVKGPNGEAGGAVTGCPPLASRKKRLSTDALNYATEIAWDELGHVRALRGALLSSAVAQPAIDIGAAFRAAAKAAAGGANLKPTFDPYTNDLFFYHAAFIFEDVGVTAYAGAAALLVTKPDLLTAAASILSVEAYHSGAIRTLLYQKRKTKPFSNVQLRTYEVVDLISNLRDAVDGSTDLDQGIHVKGNPNQPNIVPTDEAGRVTYTRNPSQILKIVYLGGDSKGGFFPNGLNGAITTVDPAQIPM